MNGATARSRPLHPAGGVASAAALAIGIMLLSAPAPTLASEASEERQGERILREVDSGDRGCASLDAEDYELVGEYAMGRMLGSPAAHESMDRMMASMMGQGGLDQMHLFMGRRFTGCGGGSVPPGFGGMMGRFGGMMGMMAGGFGPGPGGPGALGPGPGGGPGGPPGMMGGDGYFDRNGDGDDWGAAAVVMIVLMVLLLAAAVAVLVAWRPWRHGPGQGTTPLQVLDERLARGEIDVDEYRRRREILVGA